MPLEAKAHYSATNLLLMFFLFSFVGWAWECLIVFIQGGIFINRGSLYGPWIPIYGFGGLAVLLFLGRLNKRPLLCFFAIIVLCGIIEYVGASIIWSVLHIKYWDYSGYFFNIQGRICLEGLLSFGVLGMMGMHVIAPAADFLLLKVPLALRQRICAGLIVLFGADVTLCLFYPHMGAGITTSIRTKE
ncbi:MAG: putative ABC transporter permease [Coriobacteriales bacterium]|jgi:uncharacterized membrane protein|nr:putative ABC transporter permease [Coriobacteriales bacterium]